MTKRKTYKVIAYVDTDLSPCDLLEKLGECRLPGQWSVETFEECRGDGNE